MLLVIYMPKQRVVQLMQSNTLLEIRELKKYYPVTAGLFSRHVGDVKAVDGVSFDVRDGEIIGLVGESGCGKSTLGRTILRLEEPTSGEILHKGTDITRLKRRALRELRREMQIIFQELLLIIQQYANSVQSLARN